MYRKILTVQDVSCVGQCSLTVALPILSASKNEVAILPSALLSNHTMGFSNFTCLDLTSEMEKIINQWKVENITFDALYTGYLGNDGQVEETFKVLQLLKENAIKIIDPAMADFGKLYPAFDQKYISKMRKLCEIGDVILPNVTEACFLTGIEYKEEHNESYIYSLLLALRILGMKKIVLKGANLSKDKIRIYIYDKDISYYEHEKISKSFHGTGDVFASAFVGRYLKNNDLFDAVKFAGDFTLQAIKETIDDQDHWYGVKFEKCLNLFDKE
ncbi:MAG: pyridoxamine kinase [Bacilli bacterium]|nr:pyridoxamine kinase [Bacilli bacterium]